VVRLKAAISSWLAGPGGSAPPLRIQSTAAKYISARLFS
jgi:hypothetical protein